MAEIIYFERQSEDDLIQISAKIQNSVVDLVFDTGASHSFIDFGILINEGYRLNDSTGIVQVETANGIILAHKFIVKNIQALSLEKQNFELTAFLFDNPENNFKGVIGLDFINNCEICLNLENNFIKVLKS
jgi:predicted aspartyl protease